MNFEVISDETRNERVRLLHVTRGQVDQALAQYVAVGLGYAHMPHVRIEVELDGVIQGVTVRVVEDYSKLPRPEAPAPWAPPFPIPRA